MSIQTDITERRLHDLDVVVDDLTSLAHSPDGARAIALHDLEATERRLRDLRLDVQQPVAAE